MTVEAQLLQAGPLKLPLSSQPLHQLSSRTKVPDAFAPFGTKAIVADATSYDVGRPVFEIRDGEVVRHHERGARRNDLGGVELPRVTFWQLG